MRKRHAVAIVSMVSTLYAVGCSLLVDTAGLGGDLAADASGDRPEDRSTAPGDGGTDTSSPVDAGTKCEASFCDDFDEGELGARWTSKEINNGGALTVGTPAQSAPNAMRTSFSGGPTANRRAAILEEDLGVGTHLRCDVSIFVETGPSSSFIDLLRVRTTGPGVSEYNLLFGINSGAGATFREDLFLSDGGCGCPRKDENPPTFPESRWVRVTLETDFTTASLSYDGKVVAAGAFAGFTPTSNVFMAVGTIAYDPQLSVVLLDDVSCTLAP